MPLDIELRIAERIKTLRKIEKLSQRDMAEKVGIPYENYRHVERGRSLTWQNLTCISQALEISMHTLIAEDREKTFEEVQFEDTFRHILNSRPDLIKPSHDMMRLLLQIYEAGHEAGQSASSQNVSEEHRPIE